MNIKVAAFTVSEKSYNRRSYLGAWLCVVCILMGFPIHIDTMSM